MTSSSISTGDTAMTAFPALHAPFRIARLGILAVIPLVALGTGLAPALAEENGSYLFQCMCPLEWSGDWDGNGVLDEDESLDTVALANDSAVLLMHEIFLDDGTIEGMVEDRTDALENTVENYDETVIDEDTQDWVLVGRTWENADGDTMVSVQYVQVWEVSFLLSTEFVAPEDDFVDQWDTLEDVLLVGLPVLDEFDGEDLFDELA
jgi:hypothetical protein